jgi:hypothetical protein
MPAPDGAVGSEPAGTSWKAYGHLYDGPASENTLSLGCWRELL